MINNNPYENIGKKGKGKLKHLGVNQTVDTAVLFQDSILIIQRNDNDKWALPGGFVEENEKLPETASRELKEETQVKIKNTMLKHLFHEYVKDSCNTDEAWIETDVFFFECLYQPQVKVDLKEAKDFRWIKKDEIDQIAFHANHNDLIKRVFTEAPIDDE